MAQWAKEIKDRLHKEVVFFDFYRKAGATIVIYYISYQP